MRSAVIISTARIRSVAFIAVTSGEPIENAFRVGAGTAALRY
jgi:hypothetical protein